MAKDRVFITEGDRYLFGMGTHYEIYEKLGAHKACAEDGTKGIYFAVWAPNAKEVYVVGSFNDWNENGYCMQRLGSSGIYELFTDKAGIGDQYKFLIITQDGRRLYKADPYANYAQVRPETASIVTDLNGYVWKDDKWRNSHTSHEAWKEPMAIYEVHPGSWNKKDEGTEDGFLNYRELAHELAEYVKHMGYTHIELMGIAEYPFDGSWGYQVTGYYAPTSRYGTPEDFMYFVDYMHRKGIGVILDWVPAHFPKDAHGLALFDGTCAYEYADSRKGEHPDWGTKVFDYGKHEVSNFLIANALFWVEKFHVDGLRVDAVASMLYLDYGRENGNWVPNKYGGNGNLEAMEFFRHLNSIMAIRNPGAVTIAEESTAWPGITAGPDRGGLGFTFKWNMGWMHDFLEYMKLDPLFRKNNHNKLTFGMTYAHSENYILVLSHDEVVHLKCSMINKMPGLYDDKFANLKVGYTYMMGHPGKKLLFMGQDFAQLAEWSEKKSLDWHLLNEPQHKAMQEYVRALLGIYGRYKACSELDQYPEGFEWINPNDADRSIYSFVRKSPSGRDSLLFVCNFTPVERADYRVGVPCRGRYMLLLNEKCESGAIYDAVKSECDGREYSIGFKLPAYGTAIIKFNMKK
ncbi:MAG: 1,4-alpha-glucan branching protein GlgB [Lachnospiraceae bacterium]|nr:1,4-alpha-glucan branching protein GlgB [Lachnospiraceae bacterium]